jgi:hypothetical protein
MIKQPKELTRWQTLLFILTITVGVLLFGYLIGYIDVAYGQIKVGGKHIGQVYRTQNVTGECEIGHIWGRTTIMPVKEAWVNIKADREVISIGGGGCSANKEHIIEPWIDVGVKTDDPILDGKPRKDYYSHFPQAYYDNNSDIQIIKETEESEYEEGKVVKRMTVIMVLMKEKKPQSIVCTVIDYCDFDINQYRKELSEQIDKEDGLFAKRNLEDLNTFDERGFRKIVFGGVFD